MSFIPFPPSRGRSRYFLSPIVIAVFALRALIMLADPDEENPKIEKLLLRLDNAAGFWFGALANRLQTLPGAKYKGLWQLYKEYQRGDSPHKK